MAKLLSWEEPPSDNERNARGLLCQRTSLAWVEGLGWENQPLKSVG